jgi:hypothetical protein
MSTAATSELGGLTDEQRAMVQLSHSNQLTMEGHIRSKLRMTRQKLATTLGQETKADDEMQILARDIIMYPTSPQAASVEQPKAIAAPAAPALDENAIALKAANAVYRHIKKKEQAKAIPTRPTVTQQSAPATEPTWKKYLWPIVTGAAVTLGGGTTLYNVLKSDAPAAVDTDTQYEFEITSENGKGFSTDAKE